MDPHHEVRCITVGLSIRVEDVDIHGPVQGADQCLFVDSGRLMSAVHRLCLPVRPVDVILEQCECKYVWDVTVENCTRQEPPFIHRCKRQHEQKHMTLRSLNGAKSWSSALSER